MLLSGSQKIFVITLIIAITFGYSFYRKKEIEKLTSNQTLILQNLPEFSFQGIDSENTPFNLDTLKVRKEKVFLFHFWGTWCVPCETELPEFIEFGEKFADQDVLVVLVAANDTKKDVLKFLKRFKPLPSNFLTVLDPDGKNLPFFGTIKVPETYVFARGGKHLHKFVGPQKWLDESLTERIKFYLSSTPE